MGSDIGGLIFFSVCVKTELLRSKSVVSASKAKLIHQASAGQLSGRRIEPDNQFCRSNSADHADLVDHDPWLPDHDRAKPGAVAGFCRQRRQSGDDHHDCDQRCAVQQLGGGHNR